MRESLLIILSIALGLALMESTLRGLTQPSDYSWGRLFGKELPPFKVIPDARRIVSESHQDPFENIVRDDVQMTRGDMMGVFRPDALLGYAPLENATSMNNWWHANAVGARDWDETTPDPPKGMQRLLVFGESFAQGSRVRQDQTWPHLLEEQVNDVEVVNLAVDGYGVAQAYLRYQTLRTIINYDLAILMFVPTVDLWRDVNIWRDLGGEWWGNYLSMPRFLLAENDLHLIRPYPSAEAYLQQPEPEDLRTQLSSHLSQHDRFYPQEVMNLPAVIGNLVGYKMIALYRLYGERQDYRHSLFWDVDSEPQRIVRTLFRRMRAQVEEHGGEFLVAVLPTYHDIGRLNSEPAFAEQFDRVVRSIIASEVDCVDLSKALKAQPIAELDLADDDFGPRTNGRIAEIIAGALASRNLLASPRPQEP